MAQIWNDGAFYMKSGAAWDNCVTRRPPPISGQGVEPAMPNRYAGPPLYGPRCIGPPKHRTAEASDRLIYIDDDLTPGPPRFRIGNRIRNLAQRVAPVYHRNHLAVLHQIGQDGQIFRGKHRQDADKLL